MPLFIQRVIEPNFDGGSETIHWVLYESGQFATPLRVLSEFEVDALIDSVDAQRVTHERKRKERK
jgi:hypothetical protein